MTRLVVGIIGHVDHGKTALVRALTGKDTDRLPEEKQRGISIALGFAHLKVGGEDIDLIDTPGHERFIRTMIAGATGIDAVLLVIAANEGVKPQTVEHVEIAGLLGVRRALIAVSKIDLVTAEHANDVADAATHLLERNGLEASPPMMVSALEEKGLDALRAQLALFAATQTPRAADGIAYLPIDRAFSVPGHGPVVTGTLRGASVSAGATLELMPSRGQVRVRAVQTHGARAMIVAPGRRVAINLRGADIAELERGASLAAPGALALSHWLTLSVRALDGAPPLTNGMRLRALLGAGAHDARLRLLDRDVLQPGEAGLAQLRFAAPIATPAREHLILRLSSPAQTVAGGQVLEPEASRHRRKCAPILDRLSDLRDLPIAEIVSAELARAGARGVALSHLSQLTALSQRRIVELLQSEEAIMLTAGIAVRRVDLDNLLTRIPSLVPAGSAGLSDDALAAALRNVGSDVLMEALDRLSARGLIVRRAGRLFTPNAEEDRARAKDEAALALEIAETLRRGGLAPPGPAEIVIDAPSRRAVDRLLRECVIVRAVDRAKDKEIFFHRDAIAEAQRCLAPLLEGNPLSASEIGAALGVSRKYTMPLLDHLDAIRFTRRVGDKRIRGVKTPSMR